ncbi:MAG: radical SAM protein [Spirochaetales bacterium]|nr:radical SAM protein [Spirochaetales bacterium]
MPGFGGKLNIHDFLERSTVNGPGVRSVLWVQGCPLDCPGCFNQDARKFEVRTLVTSEEILEWIPTDEVEGLTISGGEPFWQAAALVPLARAVRERGLSVMIYSGFTREKLESGPPEWRALVHEADILVDGPYSPFAVQNHRWAGSGNQTVHHLTDRYTPAADGGATGEVEIVIDQEGTITVTGFPEGVI